jgi:hypothetical protein
MVILRAAGAALQRALGPELDQLGRDSGAIQRRRKFSGMTLLRTLIWTVLRVGRPRAGDYATTAGLLGVAVTPRAIEKRFTARLVVFLRGALERLLGEALAAAPAAIPLLARFSGVFLGDATTLTLPDESAAEFPGCGGKSGSGQAAVKIQVLWDLCSGRLIRLLLEPGRCHDTNSQAVADVPPVGSLTIRDLGYFDLSRFRTWAERGAHWLSRWQPGTLVFAPGGRPLDLLGSLGRHPAGAPFDAPVLLGAAERLACRLIALRAPQEVAARRRHKAYAKAQKHGGVPGREHLAWCDWTVFVTDCPPALLTWKEVVVLYRSRWQIELLFKLWKSHNQLATHPEVKSSARRLGELWAKLIGVVLQHWLLLATSWPDARRSVWKAAGVIRAGLALVAAAVDELDRLTAVLAHLQTTVAAIAQVAARKKHPSWFQLVMNPELLDW